MLLKNCRKIDKFMNQSRINNQSAFIPPIFMIFGITIFLDYELMFPYEGAVLLETKKWYHDNNFIFIEKKKKKF